MSDNTDGDKRVIYFVGTDIGHAVTNQIHDMVSAEVNVTWQLKALDSPYLDGFVQALHSPQFGGAVITMPHKINVIPHLDHLDEIGVVLGACNNVYKSRSGLLTGTNTDWLGIRDSLLHICREHSISPPFQEKPAFVVGAGGAARAAIYALHNMLGASKIYIVNRDKSEVRALMKDIHDGYEKASLSPPSITHLLSTKQASIADESFFGVGTVPDFEPITQTEIEARQILELLLNKNRGVFLDVCYKPRVTRSLRLAAEKDWAVGDGGQVVGRQLKRQWELWAGNEVSERIPVDKMITMVHNIVESLG